MIGCLYVETGNIEASFSSKMIATIDSDKPIWDQYVLQNMSRGQISLEEVEAASKEG